MTFGHALAFDLPRIGELLVILLVGLLLFGRRLPEVARSLGRAIVEFKKGLRNVDEESDRAATDGAPPALPGGEERIPALPATSSARGGDAAKKPEPPSS